ncbi:MAG: SPOR domain-containing protein [Melioribacteraceae bacterium]|nr:SPOR domain-containing protein [Melioribacteraceae bacterium]
MNFICKIFFLFLSINLSAQVNIVPALKNIEAGEIVEAIEILEELRSAYPDDPSVIFLDAVLTEDGSSALKKYERVYNNYPDNQFADASLFRIFSYYYSLGVYKKADTYLTILKRDYSGSPYIKAADRSIPDKTYYTEKLTEETQQLPEKSEEYKFTIQAGAFLNRQNAQNLKKNFKAQGLFTDSFTKEVGGSLLNVVIVGKFKTTDDAKPLLDEINKKYRLNGRVIPIVN